MANEGYILNQYGTEVQGAIDRIIALTTATQSEDGLMSAEDKAKLDALGIHYGTTEYWSEATGYVPGRGVIIIYSDYKISGDRLVPGIKVGTGNAYVQDLAFVGEVESAELALHIADNIRHVTGEDRARWDAKLSVNDSAEVVGYTLIFGRD